jgi:hypothetical protein
MPVEEGQKSIIYFSYSIHLDIVTGNGIYGKEAKENR